MSEEQPTELYIRHLNIAAPITATDVAEQTYHQFYHDTSENIVPLMKDEQYENGVTITITVVANGPYVPEE